jgi:hypothetical protein
MRAQEVRAAYLRLTALRSDIEGDLALLQKKCRHIHRNGVHKCDTGNWCKADDCYWMEWSCPDCGKKWRTEQ